MSFTRLIVLFTFLLIYTTTINSLTIGLFTDQYKPWIGGIETAVESIKDVLTKQGHTVYVITHDHPNAHDNADNIVRIKAWVNPLNSEFDIIIPDHKLTKKLRKLNLDIVHAHTHQNIGLLALYWAKSENLPLLYTNHSYLPKEWEIEYNTNPIIAKTFSVLLCNQCDQIIAPSIWMQQSLKQWGVATPVDVVPTGIIVENFYHKKDPALLTKYHIQENDLVLITVGRLTPEKNVSFLLKVLAKIQQTTKQPVKLMIVGDGPEKKNLEKLTRKLNITDSVIFTGYIEHHAIAPFFALADVYVHGAWFETQGIIFSEAMAAWLPIVTTTSGGARDAVDEGVTGFVVPEDLNLFTDKLSQLIKDKELRNKCGKQAHKRSLLFSADAMGKKLVTLYTKLLDSSS